MRRAIIYSEDFEACVEALGGYRALDVALETIIDGLSTNPYGFDKFESDLVSFRYARTERIGVIPPLYLIFTIESGGTVTLQHVEEISVG